MELKEFCQPLLVQLFQILSKFGDSPLKIAENDYLMKSKKGVMILILTSIFLKLL